MLNEDKFLKELGKKLQNARKKKGVTQEYIALETGMDRAYISEVENGHKNPSAVTLKKIMVALDGNISDVL